VCSKALIVMRIKIQRILVRIEKQSVPIFMKEMNGTMCFQCPGSDWTGFECVDAAWSCACVKSNSTDICFAHASNIFPALFVVSTVVKGIFFLVNLILAFAVLYLYNHGKAFRITVVNAQFSTLAIAQIGNSFLFQSSTCNLMYIPVNLVSLPGQYGSWQVWAATVDAVTISNFLLGVQINLTVIAMLLGYLYW
jgi:hypothetical protein